MGNYCTFRPKKGNNLFQAFKKRFGHDKAKDLYATAFSPNFREEFKDTLSYDEEGVPTFESMMSNELVREYIGESEILESYNSQFKEYEDTLTNYDEVVSQALQYNQHGEDHDRYIAIAERKDGKVRVGIHRRTENLEEVFNNQYGTKRLNDRLLDILDFLHVTVGQLTDAEMRAGVKGVTEFEAAQNILKGTAQIIRLANNSKGYASLPEEFSHLMVELFKDNVLMQRARESLKKNPEAVRYLLGSEYDEYVKVYGNDNQVVEEALGHIFEKALTDKAVKSPSLLQRLKDWILSKFKNTKQINPETIINQVKAEIQPLALKILENQETQKVNIAAIKRKDKFFALENSTSEAVELLKNVIKVESKRLHLYDKGKQNYKEKKKTIEEYEDSIKGIGKSPEHQLLEYIQGTLSEMDNIAGSLFDIDKLELPRRFEILRNTRDYMKMYARIIDYYYQAISNDTDPNSFFNTKYDLPNGMQISIASVLKEVEHLNQTIAKDYIKYAFPAFGAFLEPVLGKKIKIPFGKNKGKELEISQLLVKMKDISFFDYWLDSMANSSDVILQAMDRIVQKAKFDAHEKSIADFRDIRDLQRRMEADGIKDTSWMFERDNEGNKTGNYLSQINWGQFEIDYKNFMDSLAAKYGEMAVGQAAIDKVSEKNAWLREHCQIGQFMIPKVSLYRNKDFENLSDKHKGYLQEFLEYKKKLESNFPPSKQVNLACIQMRKTRSQRLAESATSLSKLAQNIKGSIEEDFLLQQDDDEIFGNPTKNMGFDNTEFMFLPILYTRKLNDPNELEEDCIKTLMNYTYMSNRYNALKDIINEVEVGYDLMHNHRDYYATRMGKPFKDITSDDIVHKETANAQKKIESWRESQVYGRYMKSDEDTTIGKVSMTKVGNWIIKCNSTLRMGFNWLADSANITTGIAMTNIEAAGGRFFNVKELAEADKEYAASIKDVLTDSFNRQKETKIGLFSELFNIDEYVHQDLKRDAQVKNTVRRLLGIPLAYLGQDCGQHWLSHRTAIAQALRKQVLLDGKQMSLWKALRVEKDPATNLNKLNVDSIKELDGSRFDAFKFSELIKGVNHNLFGIYNDSDQSAANRTVLGKALLQFRKWMKPMYNTRFQEAQYNVRLDIWEEGYYRTLIRLGYELVTAHRNILTEFHNLTKDEQYAVRKALTEIIQFAVVWFVGGMLFNGDDDNDDFQYLEYIVKRAKHELGNLVPSTVMISENLKTLQTLLPILSSIKDLFNLINTGISIDGHILTYESGPYKGMTHFEKALVKAPVPIIAWLNKVNKFANHLDEEIKFYERPY